MVNRQATERNNRAVFKCSGVYCCWFHWSFNVYWLDPEEMSFVELATFFAICTLGVMALCQFVDMGYDGKAQVNYNVNNPFYTN